MTEPSPPDSAASDLPASSEPSRAAIDRLLAAHGDATHRYCVAMLGWEGAAAMLPTIFGHLEDHAEELEPGLERLVVLAVAHNRCIERSRTSGRPAVEPGLPAASAGAVRALAKLQPVGRDALVLRSLMGLRFAELQRVCGVPRERSIMRVCRAWRNVAEVVAGRPPGPGPRPAGERLHDSPARWAAIREDARRFVALRQVLREVLESYAPAPGWQAQVWQQLEQEREDERQLARARAAEREAAQAERAALAKRAAEPAAEPAGGGFAAAVDEAQAEDHTRPARTASWRWVQLGVALAVIGLLARWLMLR